MLNEFVPTRYEARRLTDLGQLIVEELNVEKKALTKTVKAFFVLISLATTYLKLPKSTLALPLEPVKSTSTFWETSGPAF